MTMRRISRGRPLNAEEAATYNAVREKTAEELPELVARHHERLTGLEQLQALVSQLKAERKRQGLSLDDVTRRTGLEQTLLLTIEAGGRPAVSIATLARYAEAVGKRLLVALVDE